MLLLFIFLFFIVNPATPVSAAPLVLEPGFTVADGNHARFRLAGIVIPSWEPRLKEDAQHWLSEQLLNQDWRVEATRQPPDRYGRRAAWLVEPTGRHSLQGRMVQAGWAWVDHEQFSNRRTSALLRLEAEAKRKEKGLWRSLMPWSAETAGKHVGQYGFTEGRVLRVSERHGHIFLDFGEDWRHDTTGFIPARAVPRFDPNQLASLTGQRVRLRGWIEEQNGPSIMLLEPYALEVVP